MANLSEWAYAVTLYYQEALRAIDDKLCELS